VVDGAKSQKNPGTWSLFFSPRKRITAAAGNHLIMLCVSVVYCMFYAVCWMLCCPKGSAGQRRQL